MELKIEPENSVVERGCKYQKTVRNQETIFPSERDWLYMNTPNGCPITLDETNYGNHGRLNAYYYTDSTRDDEYVTFDRFPYDLNWSNEAGLKVSQLQSIFRNFHFKCNQCESKPNATRTGSGRDACYYSPRSFETYC